MFIIGIYFRDILLIRISRDANNCVQHIFEKNICFIMIFPPFKYYPMKGLIFRLTMKIHFNSQFTKPLPRVPVFLFMTVFA